MSWVVIHEFIEVTFQLLRHKVLTGCGSCRKCLRIIYKRVAIMTIPLIFKRSIPSLKQTVHSKAFYDEITDYRKLLEGKGLPVIFSLEHLCLLAGVNAHNMKYIVESSRINHYKRFKLRKKKGGFRVIQTPTEELKYLQRWVLFNILEKQPSHNACKGFDKSASIKQNAEVHLQRPAILKMDFLRFFDSINEKQVYRIFRGLGYHGNVAVALAKICTIVPDENFCKSFKKSEQHLLLNTQLHGLGILPQGAPTSPKISNLIGYAIDNRFMALASKHHCSYTRYADDLTFSGNLENLCVIKKIAPRIIKDEKLFLNPAKTKLLKKGAPFFVTGLSVSNESVTIPRKRKIDIEHHLHHCLKNGVVNHLIHSGIKNRNFKDWLFGNIAFVYSVEKELGEKYFNDFNKIQWPI